MSSAPRAPREAGGGSSDRQIESFDERGLNAAGAVLGAKRLPMFFWLAEDNVVVNLSYPAPAVAFNCQGPAHREQ